MSAKEWKDEVDSEIKKLLETPPTVQDAHKLAAFLTISERLNDTKEDKDVYVMEQEEPPRRLTLADIVDYAPNSKIDELIQSKLICFLNYMEEKTLEIHTSEPIHGINAENALKQMLYYDLQIGELMINAADEQERTLIRGTFQKMAAL